ncbi:MAG: transposase [Neobacillus sp.]|jgi:putative transposase|nr:transposase [Neobacillus sp.]
MLVQKAFKFRLFPTEEQAILINKSIGCSRFVYNHFLDIWKKTYAQTGKGLTYSLCSKELTELKKHLIWLKEPDKFALQNCLKNLSNAYDRFFKKQARHPRFKSKKNPNQAYKTCFTNNNIDVTEHAIKLPKLGWVLYSRSRQVEGRLLSAFIRRVPSGKYFISLVTESEVNKLPKTGQAVGLDLGLLDFVTLSNGKKVPNPKFSRQIEQKLCREQRKLSRRYEGAEKRTLKEKNLTLMDCRNYQKQKIKVAKLKEKISNRKKDFLHQLSTQLVKKHDQLVVEDLNVKGLLKNHHLAKAISEVSWSEFIRQLAYKSKWYGKELIKIDRFFPSSQNCSACGHQDGKKALHIREWTCPQCGTHHDRDVNAAINILREGLKRTPIGA